MQFETVQKHSQELGEGVRGLVSVIIPTYRRVEEMRLAAESALAQTYTDIEVIVVADGPEPEARAAVEGLDPRLRYIELAKNSGPAEARNRGVRESRGEWITFLDDDDSMISTKLERQLALADLKHPKRMVSCRTVYRRDGRDDIWPERPIAENEDVADYILLRPSTLGRPGILPLQTLLMHRSILADVGFTTHKDHEDWAWLLEAWHLAGARVVFVWEPLVVYNIVTKSISRSRRMNWRDSMKWAGDYRQWIGDAAYNSFLTTKVALKAKRAGDWKGLWSVAKTVLHNKPGPLDVGFLLGTSLLPSGLLHAAWKKSLKNNDGRPVGPTPLPNRDTGKLMRFPLSMAALSCVPLLAAFAVRGHVFAALMDGRDVVSTGRPLSIPSARDFYGRRLEPKSVVLHGAGQSDETSFAEYTQAMGSAKPMLSMSYVDLKDDLPAFFARLRTELARYPELIVPQMGLSLNDGDAAKHYEAAVASGAMDARLNQVCTGLRSLGRPVFLRVGYEFNGPWNGYDPTAYIAAFRHVVSTVRGCGLENVAVVWDWSADAEVNAENGGASVADAQARWEKFYPGDAWVDWWALNFFSERSISAGSTQLFLNASKQHRFPVMIGESTPQGHSVTEGKSLVEGWFSPYFGLIQGSPQVKAFCYINWDWRKYPQWADWGDARLQTDESVLAFYRGQVSGPLYAGAAGRAETLKLLRVK